jgi:hypothetical protein
MVEQIFKKDPCIIEARNLFRSPTLDTVLMVEQAIKKHSGEYTRRKLWLKLPRKVMWQTYVIILRYLESINKIAVSKKGILVYIWNPALAMRFMKLRRKKL